MTAIKGQNLRVFIDELPVARAQTCQVHIAANVQDISSKDSANGWQENIVTGFSWDVSVDALVIPTTSDIATADSVAITGTVQKDYDGETAYISATPVVLPPEGHITLKADNATKMVFIVDADADDPLSSAVGTTSYKNVTSAGKTLYLGVEVNNGGMKYAIGDSGGNTLNDDIEKMLLGQDVDIEFNTTSGAMNRADGVTYLSGNGKITDISVNATNQQIATFTCQITGNGPLT